MQDARFALTLAATVLTTYLNRDDDLEEFLRRYNDEFPMRTDLERELDAVLEFLDQMNLSQKSRVWKKADLFTVAVELHGALFKRQKELQPSAVATSLQEFYARVDTGDRTEADEDAFRYYKAALQATNDRSSRVTRGEIVRKLLDASVNSAPPIRRWLVACHARSD